MYIEHISVMKIAIKIAIAITIAIATTTNIISVLLFVCLDILHHCLFDRFAHSFGPSSDHCFPCVSLFCVIKLFNVSKP